MLRKEHAGLVILEMVSWKEHPHYGPSPFHAAPGVYFPSGFEITVLLVAEQVANHILPIMGICQNVSPLSTSATSRHHPSHSQLLMLIMT
jgi:hypothetical protein